MKKFALLLSLFSFSAFADEVSCFGEFFSFSIAEENGIKIGTIYAQRQTLDRVVMNKKSLKAPEYENLKALYTGNKSTDSYELYIFKEKEKGAYISFLQVESHIGHKKVIEFRCKFN